MDAFFYQVQRELADLDFTNAELQILADADQELVVEAAYGEYLQSMFNSLYEDFSVADF